MEPSTLFRGVAKKGFESFKRPDGLYKDRSRYTVEWYQALSYAMQYAVEYHSKATMIVLRNPSLYRPQPDIGLGQFTIKVPINLKDGNTLILSEDVNLEDLCEFPLFFSGRILSKEETRSMIANFRKTFENQ